MTQDLDRLNIYELIDLYNKEFNRKRTVRYWGNRVGIDVTKNNKFSGLMQFRDKRYDLKEYLINFVLETFKY